MSLHESHSDDETLTLEGLLLPASRMGKDEFARTYAGFFLVRPTDDKQSDDSWSFRTQTVTSGQVSTANALHNQGIRVSPRLASFMLLQVKKRAGNPWPERISLGRARNNDLVVVDNSVSKLHGHFSLNNEGAMCFNDVGSRNGTSLAGKALSVGANTPLQSGDSLVFGRVQMKLLDASGLYDFLQEHMQQRS